MRKDAGVSGDAQRIEQLGWMFFLKIFDDREYEIELLDPTYASPIPSEFRWRNWAANPEGITGDDLLAFLDRLFSTLKNLAQQAPGDPRSLVVSEVFEGAYNFMKSGNLIRQVVNKIQEIDFNKATDRHLFGDIYESLLRELQSAGDAGEFYTPRAVTQFMVDMINPKLGEIVMDPATGTGGFLTCTIEHVRSKYVKTPEDEAVLQSQIRGVEKKHLPHLLCMTNLLLHGIDVPSTVRHDNTLNRPLADWGPGDRVDVVVTNPPFGGIEETGIESNFPAQFRTRETADLFLVLSMQLLKPGGRSAVVLPDGTLFGEGVKTAIKQRLLAECNLHTIIRLPKGVFKPYTDIKTNLLFFEKGTPTGTVWFYEHQYPEGYKSYSKTKPIRIQEFDAEKAWWANREESEVSWAVGIEEIRASGYNLDVSNPNIVDRGHRDPDDLLAEYREVSERVAVIRAQIKGALEEALTRSSS